MSVPASVRRAVARGPSLELFALDSEAVSNAARHGHANKTDIELTHDNATVTLSIRHNGVGFPEHAGTDGFGLRVMRHRAAALDGRLFLTSVPGRGTTVRCEVPTDAILERHP